MEALSRFSEPVSDEELNALIQKAIPEKTKIAFKNKLWLKKSQGQEKNNLKYQFYSFTLRIVAGVSALFV